MGTVLQGLQEAIESLADIRLDLDVATFMIDDSVRQSIQGCIPELPEQFFIKEKEGDMEMALYLSSDILDELQRNNPLHCLTLHNLESFSIALEGVSHFVFTTYRAHLGRPVSPLELEIQAEVDKFVHSLILMTQQGEPAPKTARLLQKTFFEKAEIRESVAPKERERYRVATQAARDYCRSLFQKHRQDKNFDRLKRDARAYYHKGLAEKLRAA